MIQLVNVNKTYKSKRGAGCHALKDINLTLNDTGLYFILGKSGSGKSTLLNLLGGLDKADNGEIYFNGRAFSTFKEKDFEAYRNNEIGFVFQVYNLIDSLDVYSNICLAVRLQGQKNQTENEKYVCKALETVELAGYEKRQVSELSGGQQQRITIARAIIKKSSVILADEPTGNLDSETSAEIFDILKKLSNEKLVIVVSHDKENAEKYADGIIEIKDGKIVSNSCKQEASRPNTTDNYKLKTAKLPLGYTLGLAFGNLLKKKFKSFMSVISIFLMIVFVCGMHVFYVSNENRDIAISAPNVNVTQLSLTQTERIVPLYINDYNVYNDLEKLNGINSLKGYSFNNISNYYYLTLEGETTPYLSALIKQVSYTVNSLEDVTKLGLTLYDNSAHSNDGIYISDVYLNKLLLSGLAFSDGETDFNKVGGKVLVNKNNLTDLPVFKINGVIKTNLIPLLFAEDQNHYTTKEQLSIEAQNQLYLLGSSIFTSESNYLNLIGKSINSQTLLERFNFTLSSQNDSIITSPFSRFYKNAFNSYTYDDYIVSSSGITEAKNYNLEEGKILLPLNTYNALFPQNKLSVDFSDQEWVKQLEDLSITYLGHTINASLTRKSLDENYLNQEQWEIAGVLISNDTRYSQAQSSLTVFNNSGITTNMLYDEFYLSANNYDILISYDNSRNLENALNYLESNYNIKIANSPYFAQLFFGLDYSFKQLSQVFLLLFVASMLISVILLVNLISFGVSARKKEIGILKALGTNNFDLKKIFISETLIVGIIALIFGFIGTIWLINYVNSLVPFYVNGLVFFVATPITYLLMAITTLVVMPILTFIPLRKISKLNPVDAIKK